MAPPRLAQKRGDDLYAKIGQLAMKRDFLASRSGRMSVPDRRDPAHPRWGRLSLRRQDGCEGRSILMDKLAHLIANHLQESPLRPEWPETILSSIIDRREHLAELTRRITEAEQQEQRPGRLYDAIEPGTTDLNDAGLKKRIVGLAAIRAQAKADTERTQAAPAMPAARPSVPIWLRVFRPKSPPEPTTAKRAQTAL
ncbi:hypothetical protein HUK84_05615 [Nguyenibacter vanlangensis]|uniref:Uncharacterized protein n=1 Tax=Nguyenibacter vanlangensis TaxID=1216886 RepID=A0A7Y7M682_9PROT|nr:hypothetical protein [Nguyenibacter vanlangensis]